MPKLCALCVSSANSALKPFSFFPQKQKSPGSKPRPATLLYAVQYTTSSSNVKGNLDTYPKYFLPPLLPLSLPQFQSGSPPSNYYSFPLKNFIFPSLDILIPKVHLEMVAALPLEGDH
jgi:hypothetical protein